MGGQYKVTFGPRSRTDLKELVVYTRRVSGDPSIAERLGKKSIEKALSLSSLPERGRIVPELALQIFEKSFSRIIVLFIGSQKIKSKSCGFGMHLEARQR